MSNLQINMPEPVFVLDRRVIYGDTDAGGIVYYANYLRYFEMGRTEMMRNLALPYSEIEKRGFILPVSESYVRYKASARYDDLITISTSLVDIKKVSCRFHYRVTLKTDEQEKLLAKGFTVCSLTLALTVTDARFETTLTGL